MSTPKSHHYVPQFYLRRFENAEGRIDVFDKTNGNTFQSGTDSIACINYFYRVPQLVEYGLDPVHLERQLSGVEYEAANIISDWFQHVERGDRLIIPEVNRHIISQFVCLQMLRTVEARNNLLQTISQLIAGAPEAPRLPETIDGQNSLHASLLWSDSMVEERVRCLKERIWIIGKNESERTFLTSDHPVLIESGDNAGFVLDKIFLSSLLGEPSISEDDYVVYPLSPSLILYMYDRCKYPMMDDFDGSVSPISFTPEMVNHENSGQVGMSYRFVYSSDGDFAFARKFIRDQPWVAHTDRNRYETHDNPYLGADAINSDDP